MILATEMLALAILQSKLSHQFAAIAAQSWSGPCSHYKSRGPPLTDSPESQLSHFKDHELLANKHTPEIERPNGQDHYSQVRLKEKSKYGTIEGQT